MTTRPSSRPPATGRLLADLGRCRFSRQADDALRLLRSECIDLVLLDAEMPGMGGLELLATLQQDPTLAGIPVLLLTSHCDEGTEDASFEAGAVDFITKPIRPVILRARVSTHLRLKRAMDSLQDLARTDSLTGLSNRRALMERLEMEMARTQRVDAPLSLLVADVDHFKPYNDEYGHPAGDLALQGVAECLRAAAAHPGDLAARWGGRRIRGAAAGHRRGGGAGRGTAGPCAAGGAGHRARAQPTGAAHDVDRHRHHGRAAGRQAARRGPGHAEVAGQSAALLAKADEALYQAKASGRHSSVAAAA